MVSWSRCHRRGGEGHGEMLRFPVFPPCSTLTCLVGEARSELVSHIFHPNIDISVNASTFSLVSFPSYGMNHPNDWTHEFIELDSPRVNLLYSPQWIQSELVGDKGLRLVSGRVCSLGLFLDWCLGKSFPGGEPQDLPFQTHKSPFPLLVFSWLGPHLNTRAPSYK